MLKTSFNKLGGKRIWDFGAVTYYHSVEQINGKIINSYFSISWDGNDLGVHQHSYTREQFTKTLTRSLKGRKRTVFKVWG